MALNNWFGYLTLQSQASKITQLPLIPIKTKFRNNDFFFFLLRCTKQNNDSNVRQKQKKKQKNRSFQSTTVLEFAHKQIVSFLALSKSKIQK